MFACYLIAYIMRIMNSKLKQIYYSNDGYWKGEGAIQKLCKASGSIKEEAEMVNETFIVPNLFTTAKI